MNHYHSVGGMLMLCELGGRAGEPANLAAPAPAPDFFPSGSGS